MSQSKVNTTPLKGVEQLMQTVSLVKQSFNPDLFVGGIIITMYDGRMRLSRDVG